VPDGELENVRQAMERALTTIETGEVTTASRSVEIDGVAVAHGQIIGLHNGVLRAAGSSVPEVVLTLVEHMGGAERELVTLYPGAETEPKQAAALAEAISTAYPNLAVEVHAGGQPHYHYILSAE
jgi:dihydroxyacetone kinase-like predicted kinase